MLEPRRDRAQLLQRPRLELPHPLAGDAEVVADLFERLRLLAVEPEAAEHDVPHARVEPVDRLGELGRPGVVGGRAVGRLGLLVLDQVGDHALAVADRRLERDGILDEVEQLPHALRGEAGVHGDLVDRRVAVELLRELAARALRAAHLLGDVDGKPDRAALVGERTRHGLADPPGRVRRELVAHLVVELLDRADQAEVALLDQVEERHAGLRVVARDRHHEPQVALDQAPLRELVAEVLAPRELALLGRREQPPVADLADVELQRVGRLEALVLAEARVLGLVVLLVFGVDEVEDGFGLGARTPRREAGAPHIPYRREEARA